MYKDRVTNVGHRRTIYRKHYKDHKSLVNKPGGGIITRYLFFYDCTSNKVTVVLVRVWSRAGYGCLRVLVLSTVAQIKRIRVGC